MARPRFIYESRGVHDGARQDARALIGDQPLTDAEVARVRGALGYASATVRGQKIAGAVLQALLALHTEDMATNDMVESNTWTVIRFTRDVELPRFTRFQHETWTTRKPVGTSFELGGGELELGHHFEIIYQGPRAGCKKHERSLIRRCLHHGCKGCSVCDRIRVRFESDVKPGTLCVDCKGPADGQRKGSLGPACKRCEAERMAMIAVLLDAIDPDDDSGEDPDAGPDVAGLADAPSLVAVVEALEDYGLGPEQIRAYVLEHAQEIPAAARLDQLEVRLARLLDCA